MPLPRTSKEKSARVDWGYVRTDGPTVKSRTWLWCFAAVLTLAPLAAISAASVFTGEVAAPIERISSRGPLAGPHAALENRCEACHEPFQPIGGDRWLPNLVGNVKPGFDALHGAKCEACHAGPPHHPNQLASSVVGCAECHRDHQGRDFSLVRIHDTNCVRCHGNLEKHRIAPGSAVTAISSFASESGGHPEFRPLVQKRERGLKFSHAVHTSPGLGLGGKHAFTFAKIEDPTERARYMALFGVTDPATTVTLDCAACHQLDANRTDGLPAAERTPFEQFAALGQPTVGGLPREALFPPRAGGKAFLPIVYENHCRACHPLTFDESPGLRTRQAPHGVQPDRIEEFLREVYSARAVADAFKPAKPVNRGTGRVDPRHVHTDPIHRLTVLREIDREVATAKTMLFDGQRTCFECHIRDEKGNAKPTAIPTVWMKSAKFDHAAHRTSKCVDCHPKAVQSHEAEIAAASTYARGAAEGNYQHPPNLPGIASCRQCHAPASGTVGGVRHDCTDCHGYHQIERGLQGLGSPRRGPASP